MEDILLIEKLILGVCMVIKNSGIFEYKCFVQIATIIVLLAKGTHFVVTKYWDLREQSLDLDIKRLEKQSKKIDLENKIKHQTNG